MMIMLMIVMTTTTTTVMVQKNEDDHGNGAFGVTMDDDKADRDCFCSACDGFMMAPNCQDNVYFKTYQARLIVAMLVCLRV